MEDKKKKVPLVDRWADDKKPIKIIETPKKKEPQNNPKKKN